jgi:hypothetical protein
MHLLLQSCLLRHGMIQGIKSEDDCLQYVIVAETLLVIKLWLGIVTESLT